MSDLTTVLTIWIRGLGPATPTPTNGYKLVVFPNPVVINPGGRSVLQVRLLDENNVEIPKPAGVILSAFWTGGVDSQGIIVNPMPPDLLEILVPEGVFDQNIDLNVRLQNVPN